MNIFSLFDEEMFNLL